MPAPLPPLKLEPILRPMPWGGRALERLGKRLPGPGPYGESWEAADLPGAESRVAAGPLGGRSLRELMAERRAELLGPVPATPDGRFPLLWKLLDARERLSVQVHPDAEAAARLGGGARPKTEAWCVLAAEPGAELVLGLRPGVGERELRAALEAARTEALEPLLQRVPVRAGDFVYLPAGLVHALGGGVLLAELQQASDTTYRVFDWNRPGLDGKPRPLHRAEALQATRFELRGPVAFEPPRSGRPGLRCPWFELERLRLAPGQAIASASGLPRLLTCLQGELRMETSAGALALGLGETALLPAVSAVQLLAAQAALGLLGTACPAPEGAPQ